jgi:hypothetical protein
MLMVIFGAGASHDSASAFPVGRPNVFAGYWRPPLGQNLFRDPNEVFGEIIRKYPKLSHILPYLREPLRGRAVEEELEFLRDQAHGYEYPERLREFASVRYYLRDLLFESTNEWMKRTNGVTNYGPLIGDILRLNKQDQPVCLVTFNYDLLLDRALLSFGYGPQSPEKQFQAHEVLKLFKPHGSADWVRLVDIPPTTRITPSHLIEEADTIKLLDEWARAGSPDAADGFGLGRTVFPAIAIPFQNKTDSTFECPSSHLAYLQVLLPKVTKILIIGWQAKEAHFLRLLRSNVPKLSQLMVVGKDSADAMTTLRYFAAEIRTELTTDRTRVGSGDFTDFINKREVEPFLLGLATAS